MEAMKGTIVHFLYIFCTFTVVEREPDNHTKT